MIKISKRNIGINYKPFVIAEISGNHKGSLNRALKIIKEAKKIGASAVKLQTFDLNEMTLNSNKSFFKINDKSSPWNGRNLYDLYSEAITPKDWHKTIFKYAKKNKIICFSSVFDLISLKYLEKINCPAYKIASFENNHFPLIEEVAKTGKPIIVSTGMTKFEEIKDLVKIFKRVKNKNFAFLKCTSSYPANPSSSNIRSIELLRKKLKCEIGLSDHTKGIGAAVASVAFGATIIEKHLVLKAGDGSIDKDFSLAPHEFQLLIREINAAWQALGKKKIGIDKTELLNSKLKRSIFAIKKIKKNEKITKKNIKIIRPGHGLHPRYFKEIIGKTAKNIIFEGSPLKLKLIK
tara:strand:- start:1146 stop:2192 length:1047 start_codon:yes stop_codon:yes gene_type:complete